MPPISYQQDFYAWLMDNVVLLRSGRLSEIDAENIAEELEGLAKRDRRELINRLALLLMHLLKWQFQVSRRSRSWQLTLEEQRRQVKQLLQDSPSLKYQLDHRLFEAYSLALVKAEKETGLPRETFPTECPYSFDQTVDLDFYPPGS